MISKRAGKGVNIMPSSGAMSDNFVGKKKCIRILNCYIYKVVARDVQVSDLESWKAI